ncbi:MAG: hypothetical protein ACTHN5_04870 [Phycisphaerae bacterium]
MLRLKPATQKPLHIPWHLEATILLAAAIMSIIEARNNQYLWSAIFATAALAFGISALTRAFTRQTNDDD